MTEAKIQQWTVHEPYLNLHCKLGEGPYYEASTERLRFVDIINKRVHAVSLKEGGGPDGAAPVETIQLDVPVSVTADIQGHDPRDKILVGVKYGVAVLDRATGRYDYVARFAAANNNDDDRTRSNDGAVDPHGRFWLGSMTDFGLGDFQPEGKEVCPFLHSPPAPSWRKGPVREIPLNQETIRQTTRMGKQKTGTGWCDSMERSCHAGAWRKRNSWQGLVHA